MDFFGIISALLVNFTILEILYNFIVSKKTNKTRVAVIILITMILAGISIGSVLIGLRNFESIEKYVITDERYQEDKYTFEMKDDLKITNYTSKIKYIENNSEEVTVIIKHSSHYDTDYSINGNNLLFSCYQNNSKILQMINDLVEDVNNKWIVNYDKVEMYVYSSKENIEKLKENNETKGGLILSNCSESSLTSQENVNEHNSGGSGHLILDMDLDIKVEKNIAH